MDRPKEDVRARNMARLFFASFWVIVFTGAVRKWVFPGVPAFYLLQDVPIGLSYLVAIWTGFFTRGFMLVGMSVLGLVLTLQTLVQVMGPEINPAVAIIGLHHYVFYLPMLLIFPLGLTEYFRRKFIWWNLVLSIPMCLLALAQNAAPKSAFINRSSEGEGFGVAGADVARVMGTFNFTLFFGLWVATAVSLCLGEWLLPSERRTIRSTWVLVICTFAVNLCHLVSASRTAIGQSMLALVGAMIAAVILRSRRAMVAMAGICCLIPLAAATTYIVSPEEFNVVQDRFFGEQFQSRNKERVWDSLVDFLTLPPFSMIGAGVGMGIDAAHLGSNDAYNFTYQFSENDLTRNVMELGTPVGLFYALTRIGFAFGMIYLAVRLVRSGSSPHVLPLAIFLISEVYTGDMTRNATMTSTQVMIGYCFILGVYYHPDKANMELSVSETLMRSV